MKNNFKTLFISNDEEIDIVIPNLGKKIYRYEEINIFFRNNNSKVLLCSDYIIEAIRVFHNQLNKVLNNELELDPSIIDREIGLLCNENYREDYRNNSNLKFVKNKEGIYWVGERYTLWTSKEYQTWIYNLDNDIIFEITPIYKWHFEGPDDNDKEYKNYEDFKENYKTVYKNVISKAIIKKWISICNNILNELKV